MHTLDIGTFSGFLFRSNYDTSPFTSSYLDVSVERRHLSSGNNGLKAGFRVCRNECQDLISEETRRSSSHD